jgi:ABC-2 type transport system ATP-binding protein
MDEAERLCDRVAIVDAGRVIALGTPAELIATLGGDHVIEFTWASNGAAQPIDTAELERLPGVSESRIEAERVSLSVSEPHVALPAVLKKLASLELELTGLSTRHASLEDVFVKLAGRHLREDETSQSAET